MEENRNTVENEPESLPENQESAETPELEEKTFTQSELNEIIKDRLARARKGIPDDAELKEFRKWKRESQTDAEKYSGMQQELNEARAELILLKNQQAVSKAGCRSEFSEFVADKISKMEGEFEDNLQAFKKDNPQYFGEAVIKKLGTSPSMGGGTARTKADILAIKNTAERQKAIAENLELFGY